MLFFHRMWDSEIERIGFRKCSPAGYQIRHLGELVGFIGLVWFVGALLYLLYTAVTLSFTLASLRLLLWPLALGVLSDILVLISRMAVNRKDFQYNEGERRSSWRVENRLVTYPEEPSD